MPLKPLPTNPSFDHFRHLQKAQRIGDLEGNQRIREFHLHLFRKSDAEIAVAPFTLADAQLTVAREYGFESWAKLKSSVERQDFVDPTVPYHERIDDPVFRQAVDLIDAGNEDGLRSHLSDHPSLVRRRIHFARGGYFANPSLLNFVAENPIRNDRLPKNIVEIAKILLGAGADAKDGTLGLVTTGRVSRECGVQISLIDLLCDHGADPTEPITGTLAHGEFGAAEALIHRGAKGDLPTAAALGRLESFESLFPEAAGASRHLALALAAQHGRLEIVRFLLDQGEDPSRYNPLGAHAHSTPLHQAAYQGHFEVVKLLVECGARLDLKDTIFHGTPLDWAEHEGQPQIAEFLRTWETP